MLLSEEVEQAVKKFPEDYIAEVDSGDLKQSELEEKIQQADRFLSQVENIRTELMSADTPALIKTSQLTANTIMMGIYRSVKKDLEEKLQKLLAFNTSSPSIFAEISSLQQAVNQGLAQTKTAWNAMTGTFTVPTDLSWAKIINDAPYVKIAKEKYKKHLEKYPEDLDKLVAIVKYESLNPDYVESTDKFLSPMELKDQIEIKYMIYTAESPYGMLCLKYMDKFEIANIKKSGVFDSGDNTLVFNVKEDRTNPRGKYYTFFHEMGHAIDFYYAQENRNFLENIFDSSFFSDNFKYNGKTLSEHNVIDVQNNFKNSMYHILNGKLYSHLNDKEKQEIIDNINQNLMNKNKDYSNLSKLEKSIQKKLNAEYASKLYEADHNTVSDVTGSVSNLAISGSYGHKEPEEDGGTYWVKPNGDIRRESNAECFAGYFGRKMVGEPEHTKGLDSIETYLPNSSQSMDKMVQKMGRN